MPALSFQSLLLAVGQRPIDLFVDLSNFVMLDLGQPNHVFDRSRLSPEGIAVRNARAGETLRTLDGVEISDDEDYEYGGDDGDIHFDYVHLLSPVEVVFFLLDSTIRPVIV